MKHRHIGMRTLALLLALALALCISPSPVDAGGGIIPVNSADDTDDGVCNTTHCSLREAINWANTLPGSPTITFNIPGPGPHVIELCHMLPPLTSSGTTIDGSTEPDYVDEPVIVLKPAFIPESPPPLSYVPECVPPPVGLLIETDVITVRGLSIVGFRHAWSSIAAGIVINSGSYNTVEHNFIGIEPGGIPNGNRDGILVNAEDQFIWSNAISANEVGIRFTAGHQSVRNNRIGTNFAGDASGPGFGNMTGILIESGADYVVVGDPDPSMWNVISGNTAVGLNIESDGNIIQGNRIGTNRNGDAALPNMYGVTIGGDSNLIGGQDSDAGNLISGNDLYGVSLGCNADGNEIIGNKIGTDLSGAAPLGNEIGILAMGGTNHIIGKNPSSAGNTIAFNTNDGVMILMDAESYFIAGNTITQNGGNGVTLGPFSASPDVPLRITLNRNSIYKNGGLGVDLYPAGVTANDPGDADTGANTLLNFPEFSSTSTSQAQGVACTGCRVEVFVADGDPSGHGEGKGFLGEAFADSAGNFSVLLNSSNVQVCDWITGRSTDAMGNSSEFSQNVRVGPCLNMPPPWAFIIPLGFGLLGFGIFGTRPRGGGRFSAGPAAAGAAGGAAVGAGIVALAFALPFIHISFPKGETPGDRLPPCDQFLDPASFSPEDGATLSEDVDPRLAWGLSQELPEGSIQWRVDLRSSSGAETSQTTAEDSILLSAFGAIAEPGGLYAWRVAGEQAGPAGTAAQPFCAPSVWRSFRLSPPPREEPFPPSPEPSPEPTPTPTPTSTPTPTPTPAVCIYEVLQNSNCRASDYKESSLIVILMQGEMAELMALNPEYTHGKFEMATGEQCWMWLGLLDGPSNPLHDCDVPIIDPPPQPSPEPICSEDLGKEDCEASGGIWGAGSVGAAPRCVCP